MTSCAALRFHFLSSSIADSITIVTLRFHLFFIAPLLAEPVRWRRRELSEDDRSSVTRQRNYHHNSNYYNSMFFFADAVAGSNILATLCLDRFFMAPLLAEPVR